MKRMCSGLTAMMVLFGFDAAHPAPAGPPIPAPSGFVTDKADIIDDDREVQIVALLEDLERRTGTELAVLTLQSTQPADDAEYARRVFDRWQIGKRGAQRGALVLLAVRDRRVMIVPGPGLQRLLPEERIDAIIDEHIVPSFKKGHYGRGILMGVWAVAEQIAIDARVTLADIPNLDEESGSKTFRMETFGTFISVLVALLVGGLLLRVWKDYRQQGAIKDRGGPEDPGSQGSDLGDRRDGGFGGGRRGGARRKSQRRG